MFLLVLALGIGLAAVAAVRAREGRENAAARPVDASLAARWYFSRSWFQGAEPIEPFEVEIARHENRLFIHAFHPDVSKSTAWSSLRILEQPRNGVMKFLASPALAVSSVTGVYEFDGESLATTDGAPVRGRLVTKGPAWEGFMAATGWK